MSVLQSWKNHNEFMRRLEQIRPRLFRLAYSWNHQRELADDLVQETLAKALKNKNQLNDLNGFDGWVFKILINNWRNHLSRTRVMENIDDYVLSEQHSPESLHEQQWIIASVQEAVATLPQGQRQILMLVDLEGLSYTEVAAIFEIPIGTVMSRICRARKKLAKILLNIQQQSIQQQSPSTHQMIRRVK